MAIFNQLEVAKRQLETGLALLESGGDLLSVITLAGAAEEILGKMVAARGGTNSLQSLTDGALSIYQHEYGEDVPDRRWFDRRANRARNSLKHLRQEAGVELDPEEEAVDMLKRAIDNYWALETDLTPAMKRFDQRQRGPKAGPVEQGLGRSGRRREAEVTTGPQEAQLGIALGVVAFEARILCEALVLSLHDVRKRGEGQRKRFRCYRVANEAVYLKARSLMDFLYEAPGAHATDLGVHHFGETQRKLPHDLSDFRKFVNKRCAHLTEARLVQDRLSVAEMERCGRSILDEAMAFIDRQREQGRDFVETRHQQDWQALLDTRQRLDEAGRHP